MEKSIEADVKKIYDGNEMVMSNLEKKINKISDEIDNIKRELDTHVYQADKLFIRTVECKPKVRVVEKSVSEIKSDDGIKTYSFEPDTKMKEMLTSSVKLGIIKFISVKKAEKKPTTETVSSVKNVYQLPDPRAIGFDVGKRVYWFNDKSCTGTVTAVDPSGYVNVKWYDGSSNRHRAGAGGKYHVKLL